METQNIPQAEVYKVAKIGNNLEVKFVRNFSTVRRAISILGTDAAIAKDKGQDVRKVGKYHFVRFDNGLIMMLYYCNKQKGWHLPTIKAAYEEGVKAFNS